MSLWSWSLQSHLSGQELLLVSVKNPRNPFVFWKGWFLFRSGHLRKLTVIQSQGQRKLPVWTVMAVVWLWTPLLPVASLTPNKSYMFQEISHSVTHWLLPSMGSFSSNLWSGKLFLVFWCLLVLLLSWWPIELHCKVLPKKTALELLIISICHLKFLTHPQGFVWYTSPLSFHSSFICYMLRTLSLHGESNSLTYMACHFLIVFTSKSLSQLPVEEITPLFLVSQSVVPALWNNQKLLIILCAGMIHCKQVGLR